MRWHGGSLSCFGGSDWSPMPDSGHNKNKKTNMKNLKRTFVAALVFAPLGVFADSSTPPLDLTSAGATIAGYIPAVAAIGAGVFAAIYGVRVIIKTFKTVAK